jgi:hypothetical protein
MHREFACFFLINALALRCMSWNLREDACVEGIGDGFCRFSRHFNQSANQPL